MLARLLSLLLSLFVSVGSAAELKLGPVTVDFGREWDCKTEAAELFCTRGVETPAGEMIVIATHARTKAESVEAFREHLKEPREFTAADGKKIVSEVKSTQKVRIEGRTWIDSLHYQSEVPGYYTRYFATVADANAIVVTFTFKKDRLSSFDTKAPALMGTLKIN